MKIGFTGTRKGMTAIQFDKIKELIDKLDVSEVNLGDCVGADDQMFSLCYSRGIKTIGHPPIDDKLRAFCRYDEEKEPKYFTHRNKAIVDNSDLIIATPKGFESVRSGTWQTIRYARRVDKKVLVVMPK